MMALPTGQVSCGGELVDLVLWTELDVGECTARLRSDFRIETSWRRFFKRPATISDGRVRGISIEGRTFRMLPASPQAHDRFSGWRYVDGLLTPSGTGTEISLQYEPHLDEDLLGDVVAYLERILDAVPLEGREGQVHE